MYIVLLENQWHRLRTICNFKFITEESIAMSLYRTCVFLISEDPLRDLYYSAIFFKIPNIWTRSTKVILLGKFQYTRNLLWQYNFHCFYLDIFEILPQLEPFPIIEYFGLYFGTSPHNNYNLDCIFSFAWKFFLLFTVCSNLYRFSFKYYRVFIFVFFHLPNIPLIFALQVYSYSL